MFSPYFNSEFVPMAVHRKSKTNNRLQQTIAQKFIYAKYVS